MSLLGARLGPYEITAKLGEGGMGEVYRAKDFHLGRDVALKVLPEGFTSDPERLARFEREAKLLAQLNHPNIAQIYGLEVSGETRALVMELVEGPTLAERLERGPLSFNESLSISLQIAHALEEAHEKGIVHRDLKPQNVKASIEGKVKVLDFGLAKAMDSISAASASASEIAHSPTLTLGATAQGVILGTAAYMSPEQAKGLAVDKRADIWSFGVLVYEMLTGERLFAGESVTETLASVLRNEVDFAALPASTPPAVRRLLRRCLERNPKNRLHDIADARIVLSEVERGEREAPFGDRGVAGEARPGARWLWGGALLVLGVALGVGTARLWRPAPRAEPSYHLLTSASGFIHSARFAPDGTTIVYGEARGGQPVSLYSTRFDAAASRALDLPSADVVGVATNGDMALILDRRHVGSWMRIGTLAKAGIAGGAPRPLLEQIYDADIAPDGSSFAVVRSVGGQQQLEYPIAKALFRTQGWISSPRISSDGKRVAFVDHPLSGDDQGQVTIVDADGKSQRLSEALNFMHGIDWSGDGKEVFASFGSADAGTFIDAFAPGGSRRRLLSSPALLRLQDVATNGRLLMTSDFFPVAAEGRLAGDFRQGSFATWSGNTVDGISSDGTLFAGTMGGFFAQGEYRTYYGKNDGSPVVELGPGLVGGVSPDGRWVFLGSLSHDQTKLRALPTGPGDTKTFDFAPLEPQVGAQSHVTFTADGRRIAFLARSGPSIPRGYVFDLEGSDPARPVTPEGVDHLLISPDGRTLVALDASGVAGLYDVASGAKREIAGAIAGEVPVAWSSASDAIVVWDRTIPVRAQRLEIATGRRQPAFEWQPADPAGVLYGILTASPDGRYFLVRYRRGLSALTVAEGVR